MKTANLEVELSDYRKALRRDIVRGNTLPVKDTLRQFLKLKSVVEEKKDYEEFFEFLLAGAEAYVPRLSFYPAPGSAYSPYFDLMLIEIFKDELYTLDLKKHKTTFVLALSEKVFQIPDVLSVNKDKLLTYLGVSLGVWNNSLTFRVKDGEYTFRFSSDFALESASLDVVYVKGRSLKAIHLPYLFVQVVSWAYVLGFEKLSLKVPYERFQAESMSDVKSLFALVSLLADIESKVAKFSKDRKNLVVEPRSAYFEGSLLLSPNILIPRDSFDDIFFVSGRYYFSLRKRPSLELLWDLALSGDLRAS